MPRPVWRTLDEVANQLPGRLPVMIAPTGLNRVPRAPQEENDEVPNGLLPPPANQHDFLHADPPAEAVAIANEENDEVPNGLLPPPANQHDFLHADPPAEAIAIANEENDEGPNVVVALHANQNNFPHDDPPAAAVEVAYEVDVEGSTLQDKVNAVERKIMELVDSDDRTPKKLEKLRKEMKYLKKAIVLSEQFEQVEQ